MFNKLTNSRLSCLPLSTGQFIWLKMENDSFPFELELELAPSSATREVYQTKFGWEFEITWTKMILRNILLLWERYKHRFNVSQKLFHVLCVPNKCATILSSTSSYFFTILAANELCGFLDHVNCFIRILLHALHISVLTFSLLAEMLNSYYDELLFIFPYVFHPTLCNKSNCLST